MKDKLNDFADRLRGLRYQQATGGSKLRMIATPLAIILLLLVLIGIYWSDEPDSFDIEAAAVEHAPETESRLTTGSYTTSTVITLMETLLNKRGGYLSNDIMPPSIWLDNIPSWEFGVLVQCRDIARSMRSDFSRSQSQSVEDEDLIVTEPKFHFDNNSWFLPATENVYQEGIDALYGYLGRLQDPSAPDAQFYARADNLREWLGQVEKRLGSLSQRLSASVGQVRLNTDLAGDAEAVQSTQTSSQLEVKTPWTQIDDVFYEARGASWALIHLLKAVEIDFEPILQKKNALISLRQIIRELEATQEAIWSPVILNGSGFGVFANHSLVMASYISRANAAVIDLRSLLAQG
ncbi:MAG: DUF2333 family protein [Gammaproteobacteria bacterium]|nr:MAG: DUF2333 family protein [Gammaproteobacteria bacterium]